LQQEKEEEEEEEEEEGKAASAAEKDRDLNAMLSACKDQLRRIERELAWSSSSSSSLSSDDHQFQQQQQQQPREAGGRGDYTGARSSSAADSPPSSSPSSSPPPRETHAVFVPGLPVDVTKEELEAACKAFGEVAGIRVRRRQKRKKAYAFVTFAEARSASAALQGGEGLSLRDGSHRLRVKPAVSKTGKAAVDAQDVDAAAAATATATAAAAATATGTAIAAAAAEIYVGNIPNDLSREKLAEAFARYGRVHSARVISATPGKSFGFVTFEDPEVAEAAVARANRVLKVGDRHVVVGKSVMKSKPKKTHTNAADG